jgi:hypothetical protein
VDNGADDKAAIEEGGESFGLVASILDYKFLHKQ